MKKLLLVAALALAAFSSNAIAQTRLNNYQAGPRLIDGTQLNLMVAAVNNLQGTGTPGNVTGTRFYAGDGTVALPAFTFTADTDIGVYRIGTNNIGIAAAGAKVLDIGTAGLGITGTGTITSASATAFTVGRLGATTPAFSVAANAATSITGVKVTSAAAGSGVAIAAVGETNVATTIDAAGSGTLTFNSVATGNIVMGRAVTGVSTSLTGGYTALSGTAVPASAGAIAAGAPITMFSTGIKVWVTSDAPTFSATKGDICINTGGSSSSTRLYINNGTTNWIAITTAT